MAIEPQRSALGEQTAAQRALQQAQPFQRVVQSLFRALPVPQRPTRFDLPNPFDHQGIVIAVRPAMQRQADADGGIIIGWKQHSIAAKVVKAEPVPPKTI